MSQVGVLFQVELPVCTQAETPLASGASAFSESQMLSGVEVRGGRKEMRFVDWVVTDGPEPSSSPRGDTVKKKRAKGAHLVVVVWAGT